MSGRPQRAGRLLGWLRARPAAAASLAFLVLLAGLGLLGPALTAALGLDPYTPHAGLVYAPPDAAHPLGTDDLGRDILARLLLGGRVSLAVAIAAGLLSLLLGGAVGLLAGYFGGPLDFVVSRATEAFLSLPRLPLMMLLAGADVGGWISGAGEGRGSSAALVELVLVIVLFGWTTPARLARSAALQLRELDFVLAARALGASELRILATHVLPSAAPPLIVAATIETGELIVYESVLSFFGLGVPPPVPSWGAMLAQGLTYVYSAPLLVVLPGLLTFATVAALGLFGDGLRDALDPRSLRGLGSPRWRTW